MNVIEIDICDKSPACECPGCYVPTVRERLEKGESVPFRSVAKVVAEMLVSEGFARWDGFYLVRA